MGRSLRYELYKSYWEKKTRAQVEKELESYRKYMAKHKDSFFHESSPWDLTDGLRITALREVLEGMK